MIPPGGFSPNDFLVTAQFLKRVYDNIQAGRSAPRHFTDFRDQLGHFGDGLHRLHEVLKDHERHLFISGVTGTVDNNVQRALSEVVGDFKSLQNVTEDFLKQYKFMVENKRGGRNWAWKKVKVYGQGHDMFREMESIRRQCMFQTSKITIVLEPLKMYVLVVSSLTSPFHICLQFPNFSQFELTWPLMPSLSQLLARANKSLAGANTTLADIQQTVNRIEQLAHSLCNRTFGEIIQGQPQASAELPGSRLQRRSTSSLTTLARQDTGFSDIAPNRQLQRQSTQPYTVGTVGTDGERNNMNPRDSEWVFLDRMFEAALTRSVGLEHTKLNDVLDVIVRWLEDVSLFKNLPYYYIALPLAL